MAISDELISKWIVIVALGKKPQSWERIRYPNLYYITFAYLAHVVRVSCNKRVF